MTIRHDNAIEWPNGKGFTPCSDAYAALTDQIDVMNDCGRISMEDMSPADYQAFNILLSERDTLMCAGHVGKSHRY